MKDTREAPFSLPPTVPFISMSTHACVLHWQVPETHSHHPNPSSHIHSASDNSWRAGSFPASAFIHSGIRVSLFVLVRQGGRAACPCQNYTARRRRDLKQGTCINIIFLRRKEWVSGTDHSWGSIVPTSRERKKWQAFSELWTHSK